MFIYKITNKINGKIYIGQTSRNIKERWYSHCNRKDSIAPLTSAIKKYGKQNFDLEIIEKVKISKQLDIREKFWIKEFNSLAPNGYNLFDGGNKHKKASSKLRKKLSLAKLGKKYGSRKKGSGDNISIGKGSTSFKVYKKNDNEFVGTWINRSKCAEDLNLNKFHVASCLRGDRKSHKGYIFVGEYNGQQYNK